MKKQNLFVLLGISIFVLACKDGSGESYVSDNLKEYKTRKSQMQSVKMEEPQFLVVDSNSIFELKIIELDQGWGYEIFKDSSLLIRQKNIPAVQGVHAFQTEEEANRMGMFVMNKIKEGFFPPSVTVSEIDSLQIKH